jgi:predicted aminopeptidase
VYEDLNNAKISAVVTYHDRIPAFRRLLVLAADDLPRFYSLAASIGRMPNVDRRRCLDALTAGPDLASGLCRLEALK